MDVFRIARSRGPRCLPRDSPPNVDMELSRKLCFARGLAKVDEFGSTSLNRLSSSRFLPARRLTGSNTSIVGFDLSQGLRISRIRPPVVCKLKVDSEKEKDSEKALDHGQAPGNGFDQEGGQMVRQVGQVACWVVTVVYVGWLFLLPYAPGDPVWAISPSTIQMLVDLSLNFFFVLPIASSLSAADPFRLWLFTLNDIALIPTAFLVSNWTEQQTSEALFNIVIGWTLLFAPLLFTDRRRDRFGGSLETLWIIQMFLTNTVLAPYMAIRQSSSSAEKRASLPLGTKLKILSRGMTRGASIVGIAGALVGFIALLWAFIGRPEAGFGGLHERWEYFRTYVSSERLAYAFLWDIALYTFFQPCLIRDNLENVKVESRAMVQILRFVPYVGLVAYSFGLQNQDEVTGD